MEAAQKSPLDEVRGLPLSGTLADVENLDWSLILALIYRGTLFDASNIGSTVKGIGNRRRPECGRWLHLVFLRECPKTSSNA